MNSKRDGRETSDETCVELKYCERCGGLGIRGPGSGVYCKNCLPEIAQLPAPRNPGNSAEIADEPLLEPEDYEYEIPDIDAIKFEASGGAA